MLSGNVQCSSSSHKLHPSLSSLVLPALLPGAELISLQEIPLGCRETPFCSEPAWGFLHGVAQHHGFMQGQSEPLYGSLICITLNHRNMQISTSSELMHHWGNCGCVPRFAFRREHMHRGVSAVLSSEPPLFPVPSYTQHKVALFG